MVRIFTSECNVIDTSPHFPLHLWENKECVFKNFKLLRQSFIQEKLKIIRLLIQNLIP